MTKDEALKLALWHEAMAREPNRNQAKREKHEATAKFIKEALAQPEQEPVAWGVFDDNLHDMFFAKEEAQEMVRLKGDGSTVKPLYTTPPQIEVGCAECGVGNHHALYCVACAERYLKEKNT